jgi:hypothetical protein
MSEQGLKLNIGADVSDLQKGLKTAETSLNQFNSSVKKGVPQTTQAFTNLSRVVSDAPFGFIAIQNNLEPLLQSFQQLKQQTGSTGGALKAFLSSFAGAGGVLFAFSAASSLITVLIQKYGSLGKAFEALTNSGNKFYQQQQQLLKIQQEASKSAGEEISRLNVLASVSADTTNSLSNRKEAANELLRVYREYLPALTQEALLNNQAADAINAAKDALLAKALAAAAEKKLAEIGAKVLDNQLAQVDAVKQYGTAQDNLRKQQNKASKEAIQGIASVNTQTVAYSTEVDKTKNRVKELGEESVRLQGEYSKLLSLSTSFAKQAGDAFIKDTKSAKAVKIAVPKVTYVAQSVEVESNAASLLGDADIQRQFGLENGFSVPLNITVPQSAFDSLKAFGESQYWKLIQDKTQGIINQFDQFLTPVINTAFEALGNGTSIIKAIGQSMKALVLQIGVTIAKAAILAAILNTIFPGGAAIGGKAVSGFGNIFKSLVGFGNAAAPNLSGIGGGGLAISVGGQFNVRGTDLVAVVNSGNQRIGRVG